jgi:hypothetical protein
MTTPKVQEISQQEALALRQAWQLAAAEAKTASVKSAAQAR